MRVKFAVISVPKEEQADSMERIAWNCLEKDLSLSYSVDHMMKEMNAFQIVNRNNDPKNFEEWNKNFWEKFMDSSVLSPNDKIMQEEKPLGVSFFFSWFFACPCCSQLEIEKTRWRPSKWRTSLLGQILLAINFSPFRKIFLKSQLKMMRNMTIPRYCVMLYYKIHEYLSPFFLQKEQISPLYNPNDEDIESVVPINYDCVFGDLELLEVLDEMGKDEYIQKILVEKSHQDLIVNNNFLFAEKTQVPYPHHYVYEFILINWLENDSIVSIKNPVTSLETFFQVREERWKSILRELKPGQSVDENFLSQFSEQELKFLVASRLIVPRKFDVMESEAWQSRTKNTFQELQLKGYTLIENIFDPLLLSSLQKYNYKIYQYFCSIKSKHKKWRTYNDEYVARYYQYQLTDFISRLIKKNIANSSLTLNIYISEGDVSVFFVLFRSFTQYIFYSGF